MTTPSVRFVKLILLTLLIGLNPTIVFSQSIEISEKAIDDFSLGYTKIIGFTESGYFILSANNGYDVSGERVGFKSPKYKLGFVGKDLKLAWEKPVDSRVENGIVRMVSFLNEKAMVLTSTWSKSTSKLTYSAFCIDEKGDLRGEWNTLSEIEFKKEPLYFGSSTSLRKERFMIYAAAEVESGMQLSVLVFNKEMEIVTRTEEMVRQPTRNFSIEQCAVSDSGKAILLGLRTEKQKALSSKRDNTWYAYTFSNNRITEMPLGRGRDVTYLNLVIDEFRNEAVLTGFYSDKESFVGAGILHGRMKLEGDTTILSQYISIDASQNLRLKGARNNGESGGLATFPVRKTIPRGDGGVAIIAESAYTTEYSYFDSFSQTYTRRLEYNFGDIVVFSLNNVGNLQWSASVNKEQSSMDDGGIFSSYCMLVGSHRLDFLFSEPISKKAKVLRGTVSHQGIPDKVVPVQLPEGTLLLSEGGKQVSENSVVIPALIKRKLHLIRFSNP